MAVKQSTIGSHKREESSDERKTAIYSNLKCQATPQKEPGDTQPPTPELLGEKQHSAASRKSMHS